MKEKSKGQYLGNNGLKCPIREKEIDMGWLAGEGRNRKS